MTSKKHQGQVRLSRGHMAIAGAVSAALMSIAPVASAQERALGLDISAWQGNISQTTWNNIRNVENRQFVFLRASRGGTTGSDHRAGGYSASNPDDNDEFSLSQRYDDPYFVQNINRATAAGMFAGSYHFGRPDVIATTLDWQGNPAGVANNGTDEANHMIQMAGAFMRPGYMLPVYDYEAGSGIRTHEELAQFAVDFSNQINTVMGIRPAVYIGNNYASPLNSTATSIVSAYPTLWNARWPNQADPNSIPVQTANPGDYTSTIYGPWDNSPNPAHPWHFWQYASTGRLPSFNSGNSNLDFDVAKGGVEYLKDHLVPAVWMNDSSGAWTTLANWNSGQAPIVPATGPGMIPPVGTQTLPTPRLPGAAGSAVTDGLNDTVILDRPNANITVTHASGITNIRKLYMRETLDITGGSFNINYVPSADSTPISAQFSGNVTLSGAATAFSVHTLLVDAAKNFNINGGTVTLNTITLTRGATPAKINIGGDMTFAPLANATAVINSTGSGNNASVDLGGAARILTVNDGTSAVDLSVDVPIANGALTKSGLGTMRLNATNTFTGQVVINDGILLVTGNSQLGSTGVVTNMTVVTPGSGGSGHGGSLQLSGNVSYGLPMNIGGGGQSGVSITGPGSVGALDNLSGDNTWGGAITLSGTGSSGTDPLENQIGARAGSLRLSNVIQNNGTTTATWAKTGDGDVILSGPQANTYTGLTRQFGGRLIVEKDGALGSAGSTSVAGGNTFQLSGSASTLAFRGGVNYTTFEVINTDGTGAPGFGQVDSLSGNNIFAGQIALGGPTLSGVIQSNLGVTAGSLEVKGGLYARGAGTGIRNITKQGAGKLTISGASGGATGNTAVIPLAGSTFNINAGIVELKGAALSTNILPGVTSWIVNSTGTLENSAGTLAGGSVLVNSGGIFTHSGGGVSIASLNFAGGNGTVTVGGNKVLVASSVAVAGGGKLNLTNNKLITNSAVGTETGGTYNGVQGLVQSGYGSGVFNGTTGIITTQTDATNGSGLTTIGVSTGALARSLGPTDTATWAGQTISGNSTLVMYTYAGDANVDGFIDGTDYFYIDSNVGTSADGYGNGDFNYDGSIDGTDYFFIDSNITAQGAPLFASGDVGDGAELLTGVAAIPEPATIGGLLIGSAGLLMRRRRR